MGKPKVLVTGGAGFMGSHLTNELMQRGHQVIVLDDLSGGFEENVNPEAQFICGSITDEKLVKSIFLKRTDRLCIPFSSVRGGGSQPFHQEV